MWARPFKIWTFKKVTRLGAYCRNCQRARCDLRAQPSIVCKQDLLLALVDDLLFKTPLRSPTSVCSQDEAAATLSPSVVLQVLRHCFLAQGLVVKNLVPKFAD